jgi:ribosome-associated heat shock protein Hsp15
VALDRSVRVLKVAAFAERRGAAESARVLVEDLTPAAEPMAAPAAPAGARQPGAGRPSKRDRRAIAHFKGEDEF